MLMLVSFIVSLFTCGAALQSAPNRLGAIDDLQTCYKGDKLYFVHVMKDGGTSIDGWFSCLGEEVGFASKHVNEGDEPLETGRTSCPASFCSAHASFADQAIACGKDFSNAKAFTVLREPVSRIFSLYNFYKYECNEGSVDHDFIMDKNSDGSERTFDWLLTCLRDDCLPYSGKFQYTDEMTLYFFKPNVQTIMLAHGIDSMNLLNSDYVATDTDLEAAKRELGRLHTIFFTEKLDQWQSAYAKSGLPFSESVSKTGCTLTHSNAIDCGGCATSPNDDQIALAKELNSLDIALYEYAKTLPHAIQS